MQGNHLKIHEICKRIIAGRFRVSNITFYHHVALAPLFGMSKMERYKLQKARKELSIFLEGLALQGYRGIGKETQFLGPFSKFNFFVGSNNVGKSAVLAFIEDRLNDGIMYQAQMYGGRQAKVFSSLDLHRGAGVFSIKAALGLSRGTFTEALQQYRSQVASRHFSLPAVLEAVIDAMCQNHGMVWVSLDLEAKGVKEIFNDKSIEEYISSIPKESWYSIWNAITQRSSGSLEKHWVPETIAALVQKQSIKMPGVVLIPALRQVGPRGEPFNDQSGKGLIDRLAEIQNPDFDKRDEKTKFEKINTFLRLVTDGDAREIEIPHEREHILVHVGNNVLPLNSLGTGIHEVIMIAAFCTLNTSSIICIEEPEIHLHPLLQRKLMRYLSEQTSNQYFIATHSAALIDSEDCKVFHVTKDSSQTRITETVLRRDRLKICTNLGYRASDILQSNFIIWVEGPSDRIYLNHWIKNIYPECREGIHYSIMFYGGRLLSHLSANDEEVNDFIDLRSMNQNLAIVIDSDKSAAGERLNATKDRIIREFSKGSGIAWVTAGREIENYIPHEFLKNALSGIYPAMFKECLKENKFGHALHFRRKVEAGEREKIYKDADKIKVAKKICNEPADLSILDLDTKIKKLVNVIKAAN